MFWDIPDDTVDDLEALLQRMETVAIEDTVEDAMIADFQNPVLGVGLLLLKKCSSASEGIVGFQLVSRVK